MDIENRYKYLIGAYYGIHLMDNYDLKEYIIKEIKEYIEEFEQTNNIKEIKNKHEEYSKLSDKVKLQDLLIVLNKINGPIDLILLVKQKIKEIDN